jgi:deoxyribonuclease IV
MTKSRTAHAGPVLGAHISVAGGAFNAPARGLQIGCQSIQIFTRNQTQWKSKPLIDEDLVLFHKAVRETGIGPILAHDSYFINLGSPDAAKWKQSREAFDDEIHRAAQLHIDYLVFHPGAHMEAGEEYGLNRIAEALNLALQNCREEKPVLLIESTAGQGTALGYRFEHLASLLEKVEPQGRLGVCLDTCHLFAAGYDIRTPEAYASTLRQFESIVGLQHLKAWHLNDSKKDLGSRVDRHDDIGSGFIGCEGFRNLLKDPKMQGLPMILETPGAEEEHAKNLARLRGLLTS